MKTTTFSIKGMHCTSCAMNIDCDLEDLAGIKHVSTSYPKEQTTVEYDETIIDPQQIIEVIKKTGYTATNL